VHPASTFELDHRLCRQSGKTWRSPDNGSPSSSALKPPLFIILECEQSTSLQLVYMRYTFL
jgi:hypothetical protein